MWKLLLLLLLLLSGALNGFGELFVGTCVVRNLHTSRTGDRLLCLRKIKSITNFAYLFPR